MVVQAFPSTALLRLKVVETDEVSKMLLGRMVDAIRPLGDVKHPRQLRRVVDKTVLDYLPSKMLVISRIMLPMVTEGQSASQIMTDVISEVWEGLAQLPSAFSKSDKQIILHVMKMQAELPELAEQIPPENATAFYAAVTDAYWALQKLDLCLLAIGVIITSQEIVPRDGRLVHWLCLALNRYVKDWQSALFANDPVLQHRLSQSIDSLEIITSEELRHRLGI